MLPNAYSILLAPNPSMFTGPGTNTIVLGYGESGALVIDPGDGDENHLAAIVHEARLRGGLRRILITHGHPDHVGGAVALRKQLTIPICAFSRAGVSVADEEIPDGTTFSVGNDTLQALYTPGHRFDHLCFLLEKQRTVFAGDLVASESSIFIAPPPEGSMLDYIASLRRLQSLDLAFIVPGHGLTITNPQEKLADYIAHRLEREQQILAFLRTAREGADLATLVKHVYDATDTRLHGLARQTAEAHLLKLAHEGTIQHIQLEEHDIWKVK